MLYYDSSKLIELSNLKEVVGKCCILKRKLRSKRTNRSFLQAAKEVIAASRAEAGNHGYELVQSTENETVFIC